MSPLLNNVSFSVVVRCAYAPALHDLSPILLIPMLESSGLTTRLQRSLTSTPALSCIWSLLSAEGDHRQTSVEWASCSGDTNQLSIWVGYVLGGKRICGYLEDVYSLNLLMFVRLLTWSAVVVLFLTQIKLCTFDDIWTPFWAIIQVMTDLNSDPDVVSVFGHSAYNPSSVMCAKIGYTSNESKDSPTFLELYMSLLPWIWQKY